jgi:PAS domain S-box-containing protein
MMLPHGSMATHEDEFLQMHHFEISAEPEKSKKAVSDSVNHIPLRLHRKKDGTVFPVEIAGGYFVQGDRILHTAFVRDITVRMKVEEVLKETEEKYLSLFKNELVAISIFDLTTKMVMDVNDAHVRLYGYSREELLGNINFLDLSAEREESAKSIDEADARGSLFIPLLWHRKKDGTIFPVEIVRATYMWKGTRMMFAIVLDITERKQAEDALSGIKWRLENIIEATHVGTWEWNIQTGETIVNESWAQIIGYKLAKLAPMSIKTWKSLVHPDELQQSAELLDRHFAGELSYYDYECRMKHKNGHWVWVHDRGRVITRTAAGKPLMMFGIHSDISSRKQAEAEKDVMEAQKRQLQKVESLSRMAGAIAHHFNNQLGVVIGNLEMAIGALPQGAEPVHKLTTSMQAAWKAAEMSGLMLTYLGQSVDAREHLDLSKTCQKHLPIPRADHYGQRESDTAGPGQPDHQCLGSGR